MSDSTIVFSLRIPDFLNEQVRTAAERSGRSLNAEMLERLNSTFGIDRRTESVLDALDLPEVRRIRHTNTSQATEHTVLMINAFDIERVVLAAREDPLNDAVLILLLQTANFVLILDKSALNMARKPRMLEVQQVFKALDDNGLLSEADFCPTLLPAAMQTLTAEEMAARLLKDNKRLSNVEDFLKLLAPHGHYDPAEYGARKLAKVKTKKRM